MEIIPKQKKIPDIYFQPDHHVIFRCFFFSSRRFASRAEVHHQGHGSVASDRFVGIVRNHHFRDHRTGILLGGIAQNLLQVIISKLETL